MSEESKQANEHSEATMRDDGNVARLNIAAENDTTKSVGNEKETDKNDVSSEYLFNKNGNDVGVKVCLTLLIHRNLFPVVCASIPRLHRWH